MVIFPEYLIEAVNKEKKKQALKSKKKKSAGVVRGGGIEGGSGSSGSSGGNGGFQRHEKKKNAVNNNHDRIGKRKKMNRSNIQKSMSRRGGRKRMIWSDRVMGVCQSVMRWLFCL